MMWIECIIKNDIDGLIFQLMFVCIFLFVSQNVIFSYVI